MNYVEFLDIVDSYHVNNFLQGTGPEDFTVVIDSAKDATSAKGETVYFQNPFGLTIHKPEPLIKYKLSSRLVSQASLYFISNAYINFFSPSS